jgi:hypothetical protein
MRALLVGLNNQGHKSVLCFVIIPVTCLMLALD